MRNAILACCCLFLAATCSAGDDFKTLYEGRQWFQLRDAVQAAKDPPLFYKAAVNFGLGDFPEASRDLRKVIEDAPQSWEAKEARAMLGNLSLLRGEWLNERRLFLVNHIRQSVERRQPSKIHYTIKPPWGNMYVPVVINGKAVHHLLDTGAGAPVVTESEAKWLGLKLYKTNQTGSDGATGKSFPIHYLGVARELSLAGVTLRNVSFTVFPDDLPGFAGIPQGERGIIGLPVILALDGIRWDADGNFETGFAPESKSGAKSNLCFEEYRVVAEVGFDSNRLIFGLDTGAVTSGLYFGFRDQFPTLVSSTGIKKSLTGGGITGDIAYDVIMLPELKFSTGGFETLLRPAPVSLQTDVGSGHHGNLGLDLMNQARSVTIDFRSMRLTLSN